MRTFSELVGQAFVCTTMIWPWACGSLSHHCTCSAEDRVGMPFSSVSIDWSATNWWWATDDELRWWATMMSYRWWATDEVCTLWMSITITTFWPSSGWRYMALRCPYRVLVQSSMKWDSTWSKPYHGSNPLWFGTELRFPVMKRIPLL